MVAGLMPKPLSEWTDGCLFLDEAERYFWDDDELFEYLDDEYDDDRPTQVYGCRKLYGGMPPAKTVARDLLDDFLLEQEEPESRRSFYHPWTTAETLAERFLENLYEFCEDDCPSEAKDCIGVDDLRWAIDWFLFWNRPLFRAFGQYRWFDPSVHVIGINVLEGALQRFELVNREHHFVYVPDYKAIYLVEV